MFILKINQTGPFEATGEEYSFNFLPTKKEIVACCLYLLIDEWQGVRYDHKLGVCPEEIKNIKFQVYDEWCSIIHLSFKNPHKSLPRIMKCEITRVSQTPACLEQYLTSPSLGLAIKQWMKEELDAS